MSKDRLNREYEMGSSTTSGKDDIDEKSRFMADDLDKDMPYTLGKPIRIIVRARIIHDKNTD